MSPTFVESMLLEVLELMTSRRIARAILRDVTKLRCGAPLPEAHDELLRLVRGDLADACYLRLGASAENTVRVIEDRLDAIASIPKEQWAVRHERLVFVGRSQKTADALACGLQVRDVVRVTELYELFLAVEPQRRTCVVVDAADCPLPFDLFASIAVDFPKSTVAVVASASAEIRDELIRSGAAFRTLLLTEPALDERVVESARAALDGSPVRRRQSGGSTTTTAPRAA